ncbi:hypothetical protein [Streptomyces sp. NPDC058401]|uniref:hypothetical protein n=1 Tax=Streptomyces sp. NPDC058401 TaxID=3346480 RepID=UPI00364D3583
MRTAIRTSIVTAALAGALLAPAATAIAAPARAATSVSAVSAVSAVATVSANSSGNDRYEGEIVDLGKGKIAVLRNKSEGPEVWIRAVSPDWKPGDGWAGRVLAKLDRTHPLAVLDGVQYKLTDNGEGFDIRVLGEGASTFQQMPKAERTAKPSAKPTAKPAAKPAVTAKPQTAVVPKGPVAAGADFDELGEAAGTAQAAAADTDNTITAATGAALVAILAGLGTTFVVRARKARTHG